MQCGLGWWLAEPFSIPDVISMVEVTPHSLSARNPDLIAADMNGEIVMMSCECGTCFGVGGVGARIWELFEQPASVEALVRTIHAEYELDEPARLRDLLVFARQLVWSAGPIHSL
jgi:hypothetical protein